MILTLIIEKLLMFKRTLTSQKKSSGDKRSNLVMVLVINGQMVSKTT